MASIKQNFKKVVVQERKKIKNSIGAIVYEYIDTHSIDIAIFDIDDRLVSNVAMYAESTHIGLTHSKGLKKGVHRLCYGEIIYIIESVKEVSRISNLILKETCNA